MRARLERLRVRTNGYTVTPQQYAYTAYVALGALTLIVLSGAAVRLTGSGLGCPDWPKCYGNAYPPLTTHAVIEFSNRMITAPVSLAAGAAWLFALRRRPYRRDLMWLGALLPLGVIGQAVLGGFTVRGALDYGWVMGHFALSMLILLAAARARLARRRTASGDERRRRAERARAPAGTRRDALGDSGRPARPPADPVAALARRARRADDLRGHRRDGRRPARGRLAGAEDQPAELRRARDDGLRDPPPRRDRAGLRPGRGGDLVDGAAQARAAGRAALADGPVRAARAAGRRRLDQYKTHLPTELVWVHVGLACGAWLAAVWAACGAGAFASGRSATRRERAARDARATPEGPLPVAHGGRVPRKLGLPRGPSPGFSGFVVLTSG